MPALNNIHRTFIVRSFADEKGVTEIASEFRQTFGFEVAAGQVAYYNPLYNTELSNKWLNVYREARIERREQLEAVPGFHLAFRIARLTEMAETARVKGDYATAMKAFEQIARDVGGTLSEKRR